MVARDDVGPILNGIPSHLPDIDPAETQEWLDSLDAVLDGPGQMRARFLMLQLLQRARERQVGVPSLTTTDYVNTISPENEPVPSVTKGREDHPPARPLERRDARPSGAARPGLGVGGHISTFASSATLYEVGYNHFFRGKDHPGAETRSSSRAMPRPGCMRGPSSPGGRPRSGSTDSGRRSRTWSTVHRWHCRPIRTRGSCRTSGSSRRFSMGLGPMNAIYQAQFNRYLAGRGSRTPASSTSGRSSVTGRWTSRSPAVAPAGRE